MSETAVITSIRDLPRDSAKKQDDSFGITPFEEGLTKFIQGTDTPITIALQGEWGSGKTSLMYSLQQSLAGSEGKYEGIWLNTWEYAMMNEPADTLVEILGSLIKRIMTKADSDENTKKMLNKLLGVGKKAALFAAKVGVDKAIGSGDEFVESFFGQNGSSSIGEIRDDLQAAIDKHIKKEPGKRGFIFFIDDLDRIDPPVAVQLLELLKNIFTLNHCVFVLAIDYEVVVKGLEPKFGPLTNKNEREFRSFFDKIIQVPFTMPVTGYRTDDFIKKSLTNIGYFGDVSPNKKLIQSLSEIATLSVGTNPRSLKRLLNSLSLINCINAAKDHTANGEDEERISLKTELDLLVNFALVSIQIAYPPIYRVLNAHPDFAEWDDKIATQMSLTPLEDDAKERLNHIDEFDEPWEKVLYRLCETDVYLKKNALRISRLLNKVKDSFTGSDEPIGDTISSIISLSSVTSIDEAQAKPVQLNVSNFLKDIRNKLMNQIKQDYPEYAKVVKPQGARVQSNAFVKFSEKKWGKWLRLSVSQSGGLIRLHIYTDKWIFGPRYGTIAKGFEELGKLEEFNAIENDWKTLYANEEAITKNSNDFSDLFKRKNGLTLKMGLTYSVKLEDIKREEHLKKIAEAMMKVLEIQSRVSELRQKK